MVTGADMFAGGAARSTLECHQRKSDKGTGTIRSLTGSLDLCDGNQLGWDGGWCCIRFPQLLKGQGHEIRTAEKVVW